MKNPKELEPKEKGGVDGPVLFPSWRIAMAIFLASKYTNISTFGRAWSAGVICVGSLAFPRTAVLEEKWMSLHVGVQTAAIISVYRRKQVIPSTYQASLW